MWVDETENLVVKWGSSVQYQQLIYEQAAAYYRRRDWWFGMPLTILGVVTTSTVIAQSLEQSPVSNILGGILSFSYTTLTAIGNFIGYKQVALKYEQASADASHIVLDIQEQMNRPRSKRDHAETFVHDLKTEIGKLKHIPRVPEHIFQRYIRDVDHHFSTIGIPINARDVDLSSDDEATSSLSMIDSLVPRSNRSRQNSMHMIQMEHSPKLALHIAPPPPLRQYPNHEPPSIPDTPYPDKFPVTPPRDTPPLTPITPPQQRRGLMKSIPAPLPPSPAQLRTPDQTPSGKPRMEIRMDHIQNRMSKELERRSFAFASNCHH